MKGVAKQIEQGAEGWGSERALENTQEKTRQRRSGQVLRRVVGGPPMVDYHEGKQQ
jgi:hypothetical protein